MDSGAGPYVGGGIGGTAALAGAAAVGMQTQEPTSSYGRGGTTEE